jgi:glycosyltransferase involved in cell wall biosynthesis
VRILFIHNHYQHEGGEDVAVELEISLMKQMGHSVEVLFFSNDDIQDAISKLKFGIRAFYNAHSLKVTSEKMKAFKPDVVHVHNLFFNASPSVLFAAKKHHIPVVLTIHNYRLVCANALLMRDGHVCELCLEKTFPLSGIKYKCYRNSAAESAFVTAVTGVHKLFNSWNNNITQYISLTHFAKNKLLHSSLKPHEDKISVVPNFVPDPEIGSWPRENYFLYVGRLSKEKGVDVLVEAFREMPGESLLIVGNGPEKASLEEQYSSCRNICFAGKKTKPEVLSLMKKSAALIFPSVCYEGLPFTILEAFSTGTPVIASNLGAMAEMIQDGYNGFHFKVNDVQGLKDCLMKFIKLGEKQKLMNRQARSTYEKNYYPYAHYKAILSVYQKAIEDHKKK